MALATLLAGATLAAAAHAQTPQAAPGALACDGAVQGRELPDKDVKLPDPPRAALDLPALCELGIPRSLVVRDKLLYVGATRGIAAFDDAGKLQWALKLPAATMRSVAVDATHVGYSDYDVVGTVAGTGIGAALMWGDVSRKIEVSRAGVGLVTLQGQPVWSMAPKEATALSAPALAKDSLLVVGARNGFVIDRAKGEALQTVPMFTSFFGLADNHVTRISVPQPLVLGDDFVAGHQQWFKLIDAKGEELASQRVDRDVTSGPLLCKDLLVVGEGAYPIGNIFSGKKARFAARDPKHGKALWSANADDEMGGIASLACGDELIFGASNSVVVAVTPAGKEVWSTKDNKRLFPGTQRGVVRTRDIMRNTGPAVARSLLGGRQMVAAGCCVYITTRTEPEPAAKTDVLTLLDAKTGAIVEAYKLQTQVFDMVVFGPQLVLATEDGLLAVALKP